MIENNGGSMSFDRMRTMMVRAAEIRESEQQQIFDALDEIHARMSPLESVGSIRKRLAELPDKTELDTVSRRIDDALHKLEAADTAITGLHNTVESIMDRLEKPFAQLDGRLDGVSGKFEAVAGKMDGLEDRFEHVHKRLDQLDAHLDKQDARLEELPRTVRSDFSERLATTESDLRGKLDEVESTTKTQLDSVQQELLRATTQAGDAVTGKLDKSHLLLHGKIDETKEALDTSDRLDAQAARLDTIDGKLTALTDRLEQTVARLDTTENTLAGKLTELAGSVGERPTAETVRDVVGSARDEIERQHAGHLDEAMATFAELIIGGGPQPGPAQLPAPRQQPRRARKPAASKSAKSSSSGSDTDED